MKQGKLKVTKAYWGAIADGDVYVEGQGDMPTNVSTWNTFESHAGLPLPIVGYSDPFLTWEGFGSGTRAAVDARGGINYVTIGGTKANLEEVRKGEKDAAIKTWAEKAKAFGKPMFLRLWWEANGTWWAWSRNEVTAANYKAAWQRFYEKVNEVASNVSFHYCPNIIFDAESEAKIAEQYPGDAFVDWTGMDGYAGNSPFKKEGSKNPLEKFQATYNKLLEVAPTKPIMIGESGATEQEAGVNKPLWIAELFELPQTLTRVRAIVYYNNDPIHTLGENTGRVHWEIETSPQCESSFRESVAKPFYVAAPAGGFASNIKVPEPS